MEVVGWLIVMALAALAWTLNTRARELATEVCRRACQTYDVQMLDGTVGLSSDGDQPFCTADFAGGVSTRLRSAATGSHGKPAASP